MGKLLLTIAFLAAVAFIPLAQAQSDPVKGTLQLQAPFLDGEGEDGMLIDQPTKMSAPWTLQFASPASASAALAPGNGTISWALACPYPVSADVADTLVAFTPGEDTYEGIAAGMITAGPGTPGVAPFECMWTGTFTSPTGKVSLQVPAKFLATYDGDLLVYPEIGKKMAGPQKEVVYQIRIKNGGNAAVKVVFDVLDSDPGKLGKWYTLAPEAVTLGAGNETTVPFVVSTPYHNGYVKGHRDIEVRATAVDPVDGKPVGETVNFTVQAGVKGWYVPGPSFAFAVMALAGLAAMLRRRA